MIVRPGLLLTGIVSIHLFWPGYLSAPLAMVINVCSAIGALILAIFWQRRVLPFQSVSVTPKYNGRLWLGAAFPMLVYGGMQVILGQTDILMLGVMRGAEDVGLYAAASRLAFLLGYVMMAAEMIIAPIMARLYAKREEERLQKMLTYSVRISFLAVSPLGLALIFFGEEILAVFGDEFSSAHFALTILAAGRLTHVAFGPGALLLSMTGHEKIVAVVLAAAALANVMGNVILIPYYGIRGAAIAAVVSLVLMRCVLSIYAVKRTGQQVTILGAVSSFSFRARE
jgi:O-antigen/teichoic acid export membrane protein